MANVALHAHGHSTGGTSLVVTLDAVTNGNLVWYDNCSSDNLSSTFDGNAATKFAFKQGSPTTNQCVTGFYYLNSASQTSKTIAISGSGGSGIAYQYFENAAQQAPQDVVTGTANSGTSYSLTVNVSVANSMITMYLREGSGTGTAGANMTVDDVDAVSTGSVDGHSTTVQGTGNFTAGFATVAPQFQAIAAAMQSAATPSGPANVNTWDGITQSTGVKTYGALALASTKTWDGIA